VKKEVRGEHSSAYVLFPEKPYPQSDDSDADSNPTKKPHYTIIF
jgi:hypothetical protein